MKFSFLLVLTLLASTNGLAGEAEEIFAKRGKGLITHAQFDAWISRIPKEDQTAFLADPDRLQKLVSQLLTNAQIAADAREAGYDQNDNVRLRMELAAEGELAQAWMEYKTNTENTPDLEALAREAYLLNPGEFMTERAIDVTHLLIATEQRTDEDALALATELRAQLELDPSKFEELISLYSDDTAAAANQGNYDRVEKGDMVKPFEDKAFSLQLNEISEPVKTNYGYHLIRLNKVHKSELRDFESVKAGLILKTRKTHNNRQKVIYLNELGSHETELSEESLKKMLDRYIDDPAPEDDTEDKQQ